MTGVINTEGMEPEIPGQLMIEEIRLSRAYLVQEVAMIAAGCIGDSPNARIEDALELLYAAEQHAFKDKGEKHREWSAKRGNSGDLESEIKFVENNTKRILKAEQICSVAKRDDKTGKIERTSLVTLVYKESGIGKGSGHANRLYNEWLQSASVKEAGAIPFEELCERFGPVPWDTETMDKWAKLVKERKSSASRSSFIARLESGSKRPLIHDDKTAKDLVFDFLEWLEARPKKTPSKTIRSAKTKKIVSPKNRGCATADGAEKGNAKSGKARKRGQYKPK